MDRFKNILAVYNDAVGDDNALIQATALAKRNNATLTVIEVIRDAGVKRPHVVERQKHLTRLAAPIRQAGIKVATIVEVGMPVLRIVRQVVRRNYDLVMMAPDGHSGFKSIFLGCTSTGLMRKCPCPVWIVDPAKSPDYARILAAVDPRPEDDEMDELNVQILDMAISLAHLQRSELHIVHSWKLSGNDLNTARSETNEEIRERLARKNELMHRNAVQRLLDRYVLGDLQHQVHVVRGEPGSLLPKIAEERRVNLIVMGTVVRTRMPSFFIGNTAEFVARQVQCAILTVKPEEFVTPLRLEA